MVVLAAAVAALGNNRASARPAVEMPAAQLPAQSTATPTEEPQGGPDTDKLEQQDRPQSGAQDRETNDNAADTEEPDGPQSGAAGPNTTEAPDSEAADAAALAGKATVTVEQAK